MINFGPTHRGKWHKVNPRVWDMQIGSPDLAYPDYLWLAINERTKEWDLSINGHYIASFKTFDEADSASPMLVKLHGYRRNK